MEIINIKGQKIRQITEVNEQQTDLSNQSKRIYFVKVVTSLGIVIEKVVLEYIIFRIMTEIIEITHGNTQYKKLGRLC